MVHDVRVGDWADDTAAFAELAGQLGLEKNDIGLAGSVALGVHAVVGGDTHDRTKIEQSAHLGVDATIKLARLGSLRRVLVLHVVGKGQVKKIGPPGG